MKRGTVVLTPFPFTDLAGSKVRPAVVVSRSDRPGSDVVLAFATSYRGQPLLATDLHIVASHADYGLTGLKGESVVKLDKLATLDFSLIHGELGALSLTLLSALDAKLRYALEL